MPATKKNVPYTHHSSKCWGIIQRWISAATSEKTAAKYRSVFDPVMKYRDREMWRARYHSTAQEIIAASSVVLVNNPTRSTSSAVSAPGGGTNPKTVQSTTSASDIP